MSYLKQTNKMGAWKQRKIQKGARASRTPGSKKGLVPPTWARHCARAGKGYKHPMYSKWNAMCDGGKVKWSAA